MILCGFIMAAEIHLKTGVGSLQIEFLKENLFTSENYGFIIPLYA